MMRLLSVLHLALGAAAQVSPGGRGGTDAGRGGRGGRPDYSHLPTHTITFQQYSTLHCESGSETGNPFAPTTPDDHNPQTVALAFGVCIKDPRVDNVNDNPDTKFDERQIYNFLPHYMKLVCNVDGSLSKLTYTDAQCMGPEQNDQVVTRTLLQAMLSAEDPTYQLADLPPAAVQIFAPADNLNTDQCYPEFSLDLRSIGGPGPLALSTKYTSLGQCAPAIAGAGWVRSTDYDNADCTDTPAAPSNPAHRLLQAGPTPAPSTGKGKGGAGGDASNKIAVQFGICYMDPDFHNLVDDPTTAFDETTVGDYLPAYAKVECNADGTITTKQYFDPNCHGAEADQATAVRELLEATLAAEIQADTGLPPAIYANFLDSVDDYFVLPDSIPDTFENGQCVVTATIGLSKLTGDPADDSVQATKWEYGGCVAATVGVGGVFSTDYTSLNCREGTEENADVVVGQTPREEIQFDVCQANPSLDNLIDDPETPFDETSIGRYMPGYLKYHCNKDNTLTIRHYHSDTCAGHEADYGASLQRLMSAVFQQDFGTSLDDLTDDGAVMQFTYPNKIEDNHCYPLVQIDLSHLPNNAGKRPINLATKYHFRGCEHSDHGGTPEPEPEPEPAAPTCDEHMVTVLSAQVTQACCPAFDPNCGIPDSCSARCAPVFNNFFETCQAFVDGVELSAFHDKCTAANGAGRGL